MNLEELLDKYADQHSKFLDLNGHKIHYRDEGKGDVLLLIHGTFSSLHTYDEWTDILKHQFRIVRLDIPGFGLTGPSPHNKYNIDVFCDFFKQFLDALKINKCHIAGNSLGGWLSWEFAIKYPEYLNKLILIDSAGYINDRNFPLPFIIAQTPVLRNVFNYVPKPVIRRFIRQVFFDQTKVTDALVDRYYDMFHRDGNKEAFVKIANCYYEQNTHNLHHINNPVLVLWGNKDAWLSVEHASKFEKDLPNCRKIIYENVGHVPMEEIPLQSAMDVQDFLVN
jgi:pimeloyl-ACP methyl ester carboxylesterase